MICFYQTYRDSDFKLSEAIEGIDAAFEENEQLALSEPATSDDNVGQLVPAANSSTDRKYIPKNAVNYALTYSSSGDDGNKSPSYRNKKFLLVFIELSTFLCHSVFGLGLEEVTRQTILTTGW